MQMLTCTHAIDIICGVFIDKARVCGMRPAPAAPCYLEAELCSAVKV